MTRLSTAATNATIATGWVLADIARDQRDQTIFNAAKGDHDSAWNLLEEAVEALRLEGGGEITK